MNKSIIKRSVYVLTSAVCFALAAGSQVYANLVTNPGFEDPVGPEWAWTNVTGTVLSHGRDTITPHTGTYEYHINGGDPISKGYIEQVLSGLPPGATYTISGWVYVTFRPLDRNWAYIEAAGGTIPVQAPVKGGNALNTWEQWTVTQTSDDSGNLYVRLYLDHYVGTSAKNNSAYFDDIVVDGPGPVPTKLVYTSVPTTGVAGVPFNVTVQAQDASGHPASVTNTTTVTLSVGSGGGSLGGTISGDIATGDTSVTISGVTYDTAGTMTLRATPTAGMTTIAPVTSGTITFAATLDWGSADANWTAASVWRNHITGTPATYNDAAHDYVVFEDTHSGTGDRTITLSSTVSPGNVSMTAASKNFTVSGSGTIAGTTDLNKDGAQTLTLGTPNTFSGTTRMVAGTLVVANSSALAGSTVDLNSTDTGTLVFGSSVTAASFGGLKGDNTLPLGRDLALTNSSGGAVSLTVGGNNASTTFYGSLSGAGSFTKTGTGVFAHGAGGAGDAWTYDGDTTVSQGTLQLGASNKLPYGSGKGNLIVNGTVFNEGRTISVNGLSGTGTLTSGQNYDLVVWNLGVNGASSTFNGAIKRLPAKASTLNKQGTGTLTLTGTNSITTGVVSAGTLLVNSPGSLTASNVTVDADATLGGSATISGTLTVNANGTIGAGASAGVFNVGEAASLGANATNVWELAANDVVNWGGTRFDQIIVASGSLTLDPTAVLVIKFIGTATTPSLADSFWKYPRQWQVIAGNGGVANFGSLEGTNGITAGTFATTADGSAVTLVYTPSVAPPAPTPVTSMTLASLNSTNATLSYSGGTGGQFVLVTSQDVGAPLNTWTPVATNVTFSGSFNIPTDVNPQGFYRIISE